MGEQIEIVNGEEYTIKTLASGHIIKELRMTETQKALIAVISSPAKTLEEKIDELTIKVNDLIKRIDATKP